MADMMESLLELLIDDAANNAQTQQAWNCNTASVISWLDQTLYLYLHHAHPW